MGHGEQIGPSLYDRKKAQGTMSYERKEARPSYVLQKKRVTQESRSHGESKELALPKEWCSNDPCMDFRICLESWETFRTRKKVEDFCLRINDGVLT